MLDIQHIDEIVEKAGGNQSECTRKQITNCVLGNCGKNRLCIIWIAYGQNRQSVKDEAD